MKYTIADTHGRRVWPSSSAAASSPGRTRSRKGSRSSAATNTTVTPIPIDLNDEPDYADNKDKIKSVDELSVVAIITNNLAAPAKARLYLSNDATLTTVEEVEAEATLVFESPVVPASGKLKIEWADGFKYVQNRKAIEEEIFGDGIFVLYAIAADDAVQSRREGGDRDHDHGRRVVTRGVRRVSASPFARTSEDRPPRVSEARGSSHPFAAVRAIARRGGSRAPPARAMRTTRRSRQRNAGSYSLRPDLHSPHDQHDPSLSDTGRPHAGHVRMPSIVAMISLARTVSSGRIRMRTSASPSIVKPCVRRSVSPESIDDIPLPSRSDRTSCAFISPCSRQISTRSSSDRIVLVFGRQSRHELNPAVIAQRGSLDEFAPTLGTIRHSNLPWRARVRQSATSYHDLAEHLSRFHQSMRFGGVLEIHDLPDDGAHPALENETQRREKLVPSNPSSIRSPRAAGRRPGEDPCRHRIPSSRRR